MGEVEKARVSVLSPSPDALWRPRGQTLTTATGSSTDLPSQSQQTKFDRLSNQTRRYFPEKISNNCIIPSTYMVQLVQRRQDHLTTAPAPD